MRNHRNREEKEYTWLFQVGFAFFGYSQQSIVFYLFFNVAFQHRLTYQCTPIWTVMIAAAIESLKLLMAMRDYLLGFLARYNIYDMVNLEFLLYPQDSLHNHKQVM